MILGKLESPFPTFKVIPNLARLRKSHGGCPLIGKQLAGQSSTGEYMVFLKLRQIFAPVRTWNIYCQSEPPIVDAHMRVVCSHTRLADAGDAPVFVVAESEVVDVVWRTHTGGS